MYIHGTGGGTKETARVVIARHDGRIAVYTGTQSAGQGHEAMFAEIAAEQLGRSRRPRSMSLQGMFR